MKRIVALLAALALLGGLFSAAAAEEEKISYTGTVVGGSLHLREAPSSDGKIITTYKKGTKVEILENDGTWCRVQVGKNTGYMMAQYLDIKANYTHVGWVRTQRNGRVLNVRAAADPHAAVVYKTMGGAAFETVAEEKEGWYKVRVGDGFGYLPAAGTEPLDGDYLPDITPPAEGEITPESLRTAPREVGSAATVSFSEGDFTYAVTYPSLPGWDHANGEISYWAQETLRLFQEDHAENHAGEKASYTVEYQSVRADGRYFSVLLLGRYRVGDLYVDTAYALNFDEGTPEEEAGARELPRMDDMVTQEQPRALFCLESDLSALLPAPACGYDGKPDLSCLQYAVLGKEGIEAVLPAGQYLPGALGTRKMTVLYDQIADCLDPDCLDAGFIADHRRKIDPTKPMIALTFDDGPSEETDRILRVLTRCGGRATFCVIGNKLELYPDVVKRTIAQGSEIATHTWSHPHLDRISSSAARSQITRSIDAIRELTGGYEVRVLRAPYGRVTAAVRSLCREKGLLIAKWEVDTEDWQTRNADKTYKAVMRGAKNGVIVLCHDIYETTATAMERAIPELTAQGYQLVTVSELLSFHKDGAQPGKVYTRLDPENIRTD